jgi:aryl sulfotransferase
MPTLIREPTRPYRSVMMDSDRWRDFRPRAGDIVVATYPKCGTTWTQRIVDLLIHQSTAPRPILENSPWLDAKIFAPIEENLATLDAQTQRRSVKSHLPFDSLPVWDSVKYIHTARDGRDACFSMHNHQLGMNEAAGRMVAAANGWPADAPGRVIPEDPYDWFVQWIGEAEAGGDGVNGDVPYFEYEMTYWRERARPNLLLVHYNDLKADLMGEMRRISTFLEIDTPEAVLAELAAAAQFDAMKSQGAELLTKVTDMFDKGHERFLNKGTNGRWKDVLGSDDLARYATLAKTRLSPSAEAWLHGGRLQAGDPTGLPD